MEIVNCEKIEEIFLNYGVIQQLYDSNFTEEEIFKYLPILINAYGEIDTFEFVDVLLSEQNRILLERELRVKEVEEGEEKQYREGICEDIKKQIGWVERNRGNIDEALEVK